MTLKIRNAETGFAAIVTGLDLASPLNRSAIEALEAAIATHAVLVFPGQVLTDEQQQRFSRAFGALEDKSGGNVTKAEDQRLDTTMNDVSNLGQDNKPLARDNRQRLFNLGNRLWHSDSSYRATPAKFSLLSGREIPSNGGGNTEFSDMRAAYDALAPEVQARAGSLVCEHSLMYSRGALGFEITDAERETFRPVRQSLVRRHPSSDRKSLFLSAHAGTIVGWPIPEAKMFLRDLMEHATQRAFVYSHVWQKNDLIMWDNRCTMHRACAFDETQVRDMRRTTVAGDEMTAEQAA